MRPGVLQSTHLPQWFAKTVLPIELSGRALLLDAVAYQGEAENEQLLALVHGGVGSANDPIPLVRVHSGCITGDIFHSLRCDCYQQLQMALKAICEGPRGVFVYLPYQEGRGIGLFKKLQSYALQDRGADTLDANTGIGVPADSRDYAFAARALYDLGMPAVRLLTNNPAKVRALTEHGIRVVERVPLVVEPNDFNRRYLETKRTRMGHEC